MIRVVTSQGHGDHLRAHHQHSGAGVVLGEVLGQAQRHAAAVAADLVQHEAPGGEWEAEEPDDLEVGAGDAPAHRRAEDEVRDAGRRPAPVADGAPCCFRAEQGHGGVGEILAQVE